MKILGTASVLALLGSVAPVMALDIGGGFSLTGKLEYEHISTKTTEQSFGLLDADLSYESASGFGGFIGVQGISVGSSTEALYGALSYSGDFGKIQIGAPRNALDDYIGAPALGGLDYLDLQLGMFTGSILPIQVLSSSADAAAGIRYDGNFGGARVGVSYHDLEGGQVLDVAVNYSFGETIVKAGGEHVNGSGLSASSFFIGAEHDFGQVTAGAIVGTSDILSSNVRSVSLYAVYSPTDRLDLTATALHVNGLGSDGTLYGIAANYDLTDDVFVEAGYLGSSGGAFFGSDIVNVSVGVKF